MSGVGRNGSEVSIRQAGFTQYEDVITEAEGVRIEGDRFEIDFRILTRCLACGGSIIIPDGEISNGGGLLVECLGLGAEILTGAANPNVLRLDFTLDRDGHIMRVDILGKSASHDERRKRGGRSEKRREGVERDTESQ